jgi:hypothetical protein
LDDDPVVVPLAAPADPLDPASDDPDALVDGSAPGADGEPASSAVDSWPPSVDPWPASAEPFEAALARRSFLAQPEPLKWTAGAAMALRIGPEPHKGQAVGGSAWTPWMTSKRRPQAAHT